MLMIVAVICNNHKNCNGITIAVVDNDFITVVGIPTKATCEDCDKSTQVIQNDELRASSVPQDNHLTMVFE